MKRLLEWLKRILESLFGPRRRKKSPTEDIYPLF